MLILSYKIKKLMFLLKFDIEICNNFLQKLKSSFLSMGGPAFSKSSFSAKSCCSEKFLLDLPNSFSPAFKQKAVVAVCNSNAKQYLILVFPDPDLFSHNFISGGLILFGVTWLGFPVEFSQHCAVYIYDHAYIWDVKFQG